MRLLIPTLVVLATCWSVSMAKTRPVGSGGPVITPKPDSGPVDRVTMDIKPRSCPNPFNIKLFIDGKRDRKGGGVVPVAVLGTSVLDVEDIDVSSIRLEGVEPVRYAYEDVTQPPNDDNGCPCTTAGPDGYTDLTLKFRKSDLAHVLLGMTLREEMPVVLTGRLRDGTQIEAIDCFRIRVEEKASLIVECPRDTLIAAFSTIPTITLPGFKIINPPSSGSSLQFEYSVSTEGPGTLIDNGDPKALSGTTPLLAPGECYVPPAAALAVPGIRTPTEQVTTYRVSVVGLPSVADSCRSLVSFDAPVPAFITLFVAVPTPGGVNLRWEVFADEEVKGYRLYRVGPSASDGFETNVAGGLIDPSVTAYEDQEVDPGGVYRYTLAVVLGDGSETRSLPVKVHTTEFALALEQNHPNPFNPSTTISFTLPAEADVQLSVYDVTGHVVRRLVDERLDAGFRSILWDGRNERGEAVASGVYFYRLDAGKRTLTRRMVLLK